MSTPPNVTLKTYFSVDILASSLEKTRGYMVETKGRRDALAERLQNSPNYDGLALADAETLARTIRASKAERDLRQRDVEKFDKVEPLTPMHLVRQHSANMALERLNAQLAHWEAECGFSF